MDEVFDSGVEEPVYNCTVAEYHTYFVGGEEWGYSAWAHNGCSAELRRLVLRAARVARTASRAARGGVYVLRNAAGRVMRSGRSGNVARRIGEHARDPNLQGLRPEQIFRTNNRSVRRGLEQALHEVFNPPLDRINAIDPRNPDRARFVRDARRFLQQLLERGGG